MHNNCKLRASVYSAMQSNHSSYYAKSAEIDHMDEVLPQDKDNNTIDNKNSDQTWFDSPCTCKVCNHGLARDCMKSDCNCCSSLTHSMVLDGIEGFPPTEG